MSSIENIFKIVSPIIGFYVIYKFFTNKNTIDNNNEYIKSDNVQSSNNERSYDNNDKKYYTLIIEGKINNKKIIIISHSDIPEDRIKDITNDMIKENIQYIDYKSINEDKRKYYKTQYKNDPLYRKYNGHKNWFISINSIYK